MTGRADFWSRRKARVAAEERAVVEEKVALTEAEERARLEACSDDEILAELNLPDPDTLTKGDDFTGFMVKTVPERIRRRALRKLWVSNPVLACVDGLNDYDEDYNIVAVSGSAMKTAYQVGRGIVRDILEDTEADSPVVASAVPDTDAPDTPDATTALSDPAADVADPARDAHAGTDVIPTSYRHDTAQVLDVEPAPRRRMRFAFDGASDNPQDTLA